VPADDAAESAKTKKGEARGLVLSMLILLLSIPALVGA
jgi:hypothetical protein